MEDGHQLRARGARGAVSSASRAPSTASRRRARRDGRPPSGCTRGRSSSGARWPAGRSSSSPFVRTEFLELPVPAFRSREHDPGRLEHDARRPLEMTDAVTGRAGRPARVSRRSDPRSADSDLDRAAQPAHARRSADRWRARSVRFRSSGSAGAILQSEARRCACSLSCTSAYPWLAWNALDAIHPVTLAMPLFLFALWFLDTDRIWAFAGCAVLAAMCGELIGYPARGSGRLVCARAGSTPARCRDRCR